MTGAEETIWRGLIRALTFEADDARVTVNDPNDSPVLSPEFRVENALYVTAIAGGFGKSVWMPRYMLADTEALDGLGRALALDIDAYRAGSK